jgi:hypothetical protein
MTTNFSFNDINVLTHKQQFINDELSLRILQYDNSIAEMYFVNKGRRTNIPFFRFPSKPIVSSNFCKILYIKYRFEPFLIGPNRNIR